MGSAGIAVACGARRDRCGWWSRRRVIGCADGGGRTLRTAVVSSRLVGTDVDASNAAVRLENLLKVLIRNCGVKVNDENLD